MGMATIAQYREKHALTLEAFGALIGKSKPHVHEIENAMRCSAKLALAIEAATKGEIDAAALNEEIAMARKAAA
jgi:DNA-binding transcriptional regulator YdaS (Cro superfamily)